MAEKKMTDWHRKVLCNFDMRGQKTELIHGLSLTLKTNRTLTATAHNIVQNRSLTASSA